VCSRSSTPPVSSGVKPNFTKFRQVLAIFCKFSPKFHNKKKEKFAQTNPGLMSYAHPTVLRLLYARSILARPLLQKNVFWPVTSEKL